MQLARVHGGLRTDDIQGGRPRDKSARRPPSAEALGERHAGRSHQRTKHRNCTSGLSRTGMQCKKGAMPPPTKMGKNMAPLRWAEMKPRPREQQIAKEKNK